MIYCWSCYSFLDVRSLARSLCLFPEVLSGGDPLYKVALKTALHLQGKECITP